MKAVVLKGVNDLVVEDVPDPKITQGNQVLVKIDVCGLCGTDVHMWAGTNNEGTFPFIPGHEWSGTIVEVGKDVRALKVGDRVTGEPFIGCKTCEVCHEGAGPAFCPNHRYYGFTAATAGGFAEYHISPQERLLKVPDTMSDEAGALVEGVSVAYYAVWGEAGGAAPHDRIGIFGAGPIGLFALATCLVGGADVIVVEPASFRQKMARDLGAETIVDPSEPNTVEKIMAFTDGLGLTKIIECSGNSSAIAMTMDVIGVDGNIVLTGQSVGAKIPVEIGKTIWKHTNISGYAGAHHYFCKTIRFMSKRLIDLEKVITHRFALDDALEAFTLGNKGTESAKIMIYPDAGNVPSK